MRWLIDYASQQAWESKPGSAIPINIEKAFLFAECPRATASQRLAGSSGSGRASTMSYRTRQLSRRLRAAGRSRETNRQTRRTLRNVRTNIKEVDGGFAPFKLRWTHWELILKRRAIDADQVQSVTVRVATSEASLVNNREMPDICMQYMIAVMLLDKTASFQAAHDKARMQDPAILKQRAKVQLIPDAELERHLPAREAIVEVTLTDGTRLTETVKSRPRHGRKSDAARRSDRQGARSDDSRFSGQSAAANSSRPR